jgi:hypothetical protein
MELTDEQYEAAKRELYRRWPAGRPEAEAALLGTLADMLAHGIEESRPVGPEGEQR